MNVLLVGHSAGARALFRALRGPDRRDTIHCAGGPEGVRVLLEAGNRYGFALVHDPGEGADSHEVVTALRKSNPEVALAYLSLEHEREESRNDSAPKLLAAFEKASSGKRILNCLLAPSGPVEQDCARGADDFIFEYQAPCRPVGGSGD